MKGYLDQMVSEEFRHKRDRHGRLVGHWYLKSGYENHWRNCEAYQLALAEIITKVGRHSIRELPADMERVSRFKVGTKRPDKPGSGSQGKTRKSTGGWGGMKGGAHV